MKGIKASGAVERLFNTILEVIRYDYPEDVTTFPKGHGARDFPGEPPQPDNRVPWDARKWNHDRRFYSQRQAHVLSNAHKIPISVSTTPKELAKTCLHQFARSINDVAPFDLRVGKFNMRVGKTAARMEFTVSSQGKCWNVVENTFTYNSNPGKAIKLACAYALIEGAKTLPCVRKITFDLLKGVRQATQFELRRKIRVDKK